MYEAISSGFVKRTQRPHKCLWCGTTIDKGSSAFTEAWKWEGDFWSGHYHTECKEAIKKSTFDDEGFALYENGRGVPITI